MNSSLSFGLLWNLSHSESIEIIRPTGAPTGNLRAFQSSSSSGSTISIHAFFPVLEADLLSLLAEEKRISHPRPWLEIGYTGRSSSEVTNMVITAVYRKSVAEISLAELPFSYRQTFCHVMYSSNRIRQELLHDYHPPGSNYPVPNPSGRQILSESHEFWLPDCFSLREGGYLKAAFSRRYLGLPLLYNSHLSICNLSTCHPRGRLFHKSSIFGI